MKNLLPLFILFWLMSFGLCCEYLCIVRVILLYNKLGKFKLKAVHVMTGSAIDRT